MPTEVEILREEIDELRGQVEIHRAELISIQSDDFDSLRITDLEEQVEETALKEQERQTDDPITDHIGGGDVSSVGAGWMRSLYGGGGTDESCTRFVLSPGTDLVGDVSIGSWKRNGHTVNLAADSSVIIFDNTVNFVYLLLASSTFNPSLHPETVGLHIEPDGSERILAAQRDEEGIYVLVGTLTTVDGVVTETLQLWCGGDIDDHWTIVDDESIEGDATNKISSLDKRSNATDQSYGNNPHADEYQIFDADKVVDLAAYAPDSSDGAVTANKCFALVMDREKRKTLWIDGERSFESTALTLGGLVTYNASTGELRQPTRDITIKCGIVTNVADAVDNLITTFEVCESS